MKQRCTARKLSVVHALAIFCLGLASAFSASATGFFEREQREFLPVEEAFQTSLSTGADGLTLHFDIAPEHYLYEKQFRLTWPAGLEDLPELPMFSGSDSRASWHDDPTFGRVKIYRDRVDWPLRLPELSTAQAQRFEDAGSVLNVR